MLEIKNVSKIYQTKTEQAQALKNVSLKFNNNGLYFILGKSGCGKSTLLNLIAGLDNVTSGKISLDGNDLLISTLFNTNYYKYNQNKLGSNLK